MTASLYPTRISRQIWARRSTRRTSTISRVQRGSYEADYGDRTYGIFNIVPRTGFERDKECDLVTSLRKFLSNQRSDQLWRTHAAVCLLREPERKPKQLRTSNPDRAGCSRCGERLWGICFVHFQSRFPRTNFGWSASLRQDYYQIPYDPDPNSAGNQVYPSFGLRDGEHETDGYVAFSWVHTFNPNLLLTVSPFYHYSNADYQPRPTTSPVATNANQTSNYGGLQASINANVWKNDIQAGLYGFAQHQSNYFNNQFTDGSPNFPPLQLPSREGLKKYLSATNSK